MTRILLLVPDAGVSRCQTPSPTPLAGWHESVTAVVRDRTCLAGPPAAVQAVHSRTACARTVCSDVEANARVRAFRAALSKVTQEFRISWEPGLGGAFFNPRGRRARVQGVRRKGLGAPVPAPVRDPPPVPAGVQGALAIQCAKWH